MTILYHGPSMIDGAEIVAIATESSANSKTGAMAQVWILRADVPPQAASRDGRDVSICGDCPHRFNPATGKRIRLGAYGDPAAVPAHVWEQLLEDSDGRTGYTHQWAHRDPLVRANAAALRPYVMASADSIADHQRATAAGWRTFRVRTASSPLLERERVCPASTEAGARTECAACRACSGTAGRGHSNITIIAHGAQARAFKEAAA